MRIQGARCGGVVVAARKRASSQPEVSSASVGAVARARLARREAERELQSGVARLVLGRLDFAHVELVHQVARVHAVAISCTAPYITHTNINTPTSSAIVRKPAASEQARTHPQRAPSNRGRRS